MAYILMTYIGMAYTVMAYAEVFGTAGLTDIKVECACARACMCMRACVHHSAPFLENFATCARPRPKQLARKYTSPSLQLVKKMSDQELKDVGIEKLGHRKALLEQFPRL